MRALAAALGLAVLSGLGAWDTVTLTFAGDIMAHDVNYRMADYDRIYDDVRDFLKRDDLSFANLEFPVDDTAPYSTYPLFNVQTPYVEAAIRGGFDAFSLANNHSNDRGRRGLVQTWAAAADLNRRYGVLFHGLRVGDAGDLPAVRVVRGVRVGLMAQTNLLNSPVGLERIRFAGWIDWFRRQPDPARREEILEEVRRVARQVDLMVVSLHDGVEYQSGPQPEQREFYQRLRQAGAHVVWVHHPHVLNPWQRVGEGLVLYSMGNFISGQRHMLGPRQYDEYRAERGDGALVRVRFRRGEDGRWRMADPEVQFVTHYRESGVGWVVRRLPELLSALEPADPWLEYYRYRYRAMQRRFQPLSPRWIWEDLTPRVPPATRFRRLGP